MPSGEEIRNKGLEFEKTIREILNGKIASQEDDNVNKIDVHTEHLAIQVKKCRRVAYPKILNSIITDKIPIVIHQQQGKHNGAFVFLKLEDFLKICKF